jgi:hypothetical protein
MALGFCHVVLARVYHEYISVCTQEYTKELCVLARMHVGFMCAWCACMQASTDVLDAKSLVRRIVTTSEGAIKAHATRITELERLVRVSRAS